MASPPKQVQQGKEQADPGPPDKQQLYGAPQGGTVTGPDKFAGQRLGGMGKTIDEEGEEHEELHQEGIHRQDSILSLVLHIGTGRACREDGEYRHQAHGPDKDILVDQQEVFQLFPLDGALQGPVPEQPPEIPS
jgi:hypothetical protein